MSDLHLDPVAWWWVGGCRSPWTACAPIQVHGSRGRPADASWRSFLASAAFADEVQVGGCAGGKPALPCLALLLVPGCQLASSLLPTVTQISCSNTAVLYVYVPACCCRCLPPCALS
jgi:hypothetical protein